MFVHVNPLSRRPLIFPQVQCPPSPPAVVDRLLGTLARTRLYCNNRQGLPKLTTYPGGCSSQNLWQTISPADSILRSNVEFPGEYSPCCSVPPSSSTPPRRFYAQFAANANNRCNFPSLPPFLPPRSTAILSIRRSKCTWCTFGGNTLVHRMD